MVFLTIGSTGFLVVKLQSCLNSLGFSTGGPPDGKYGPNTRTAVKAFKQGNPPLDPNNGDVDNVFWSLLSTRCSSLPSGLDGFAGMDRTNYPGDVIMRDIKNNTNMTWTGCYIPSPCHGSSDWIGHRAFLEGIGWGVVPIYMGQQSTAKTDCPSNAHHLNVTQGIIDGTDAVAKVRSAGFRLGTIIYLDVEQPLPTGDLHSMIEYASAWINTVFASGYWAGIYCSHLIPEMKDQTTNLKLKFHESLPGLIQYWLVSPNLYNCNRDAHNHFPNPHPSVIFTNFSLSIPNGNVRALQLILSPNPQCNITYAPGKTLLNVDLNSADFPNPAKPSFTQDNWKWCNKCQGLAFAGNVSSSKCPSDGGQHNHDTSFNYMLFH